MGLPRIRFDLMSRSPPYIGGEDHPDFRSGLNFCGFWVETECWGFDGGVGQGACFACEKLICPFVCLWRRVVSAARRPKVAKWVRNDPVLDPHGPRFERGDRGGVKFKGFGEKRKIPGRRVRRSGMELLRRVRSACAALSGGVSLTPRGRRRGREWRRTPGRRRRSSCWS